MDSLTQSVNEVLGAVGFLILYTLFNYFCWRGVCYLGKRREKNNQAETPEYKKKRRIPSENADQL
jgi:hypothetical protein